MDLSPLDESFDYLDFDDESIEALDILINFLEDETPSVLSIPSKMFIDCPYNHSPNYYKCIVCNPKCECIHGKVKYNCLECMCRHKRLASNCKLC